MPKYSLENTRRVIYRDVSDVVHVINDTRDGKEYLWVDDDWFTYHKREGTSPNNYTLAMIFIIYNIPVPYDC